MSRLTISFILLAGVLWGCARRPLNVIKPEPDTHAMISGMNPQLDSILLQKEELRIQFIYTRIDRDPSGKPAFTDHYFNVDTGLYFYPASTVKFPVAVLALEKLNKLAIPGLDKNSMMITEADRPGQTKVYNDPSSPNGPPSIAHYIRKILLVSDNDAFNRLYEFLGQEEINQRLHEMGYPGVQILHRLSIRLSEMQNRQTNPVLFLDTAGNVLLNKPGVESNMNYARRHTFLGKGYLQNNDTVWQAFDFSRKNRFYLADLHEIMRSVMFPDAVPKKHRFDLSADDHAFLRQYLGRYPRESQSPVYDTSFKDSYAKLYVPPQGFGTGSGIRIYSKAGWAYGFLTDVAYITDSLNNVEFMLSATIYCNSDGVFNDDKYDYEQVGYPFLRNLFQAFYKMEVERKRTIVQ